MISKQHTQDSCLIKCMALAWQSPLLVKLSPHHSSQLLLLEKHPDNYKQIVPLSSFNVQHIIRKHGFTESYYCCGNIEVIIKKSQWEKILYLARRQDTKNIYSSLSYSWIPNRHWGQHFWKYWCSYHWRGSHKWDTHMPYNMPHRSRPFDDTAPVLSVDSGQNSLI